MKDRIALDLIPSLFVTNAYKGSKSLGKRSSETFFGPKWVQRKSAISQVGNVSLEAKWKAVPVLTRGRK